MIDQLDNKDRLNKHQAVKITELLRKAGSIQELVPVQIDERTTVYVKKGTDPDLVKFKYQNRERKGRR